MIEKILVSAALGGILGLERELRHKPAGIKTNALVAVASCSFLLLADTIDPSEKVRMMTGIVQGVGFIGGGLILKEGPAARGLTTAAAIWVSAALGLACAAKQWKLAVVVLLTTLLVLRGTRLFLRKDEEDT